MTFATVAEARKALDRLRYTRAIAIERLCQEDRVVLAADGFGIQRRGDVWLIWRRLD